ncbi:hypothetical protein M885DRAFT_523074 [Pelagophyceae sp. CCMP2097]|nr:hypothetical protein M885DRAFT_523074 [Pelagophyceae sp. CCMP2097]
MPPNEERPGTALQRPEDGLDPGKFRDAPEDGPVIFFQTTSGQKGGPFDGREDDLKTNSLAGRRGGRTGPSRRCRRGGPEDGLEAVSTASKSGPGTVYSGRVGFSICGVPSGRGFVKRPNPSSKGRVRVRATAKPAGCGFAKTHKPGKPDPRVEGQTQTPPCSYLRLLETAPGDGPWRRPFETAL